MSLRELLDRFDEAVPGVSPVNQAAPGRPNTRRCTGLSSLSPVSRDFQKIKGPPAQFPIPLAFPLRSHPHPHPASKSAGDTGDTGDSQQLQLVSAGVKISATGDTGTGICEHCMHFERDPGPRRLHRCGLGGLCLTQRQSGECGPSGALWARKQP